MTEERESENTGITCLMFDGRKDKTNIINEDGSKQEVTEEHISLVQEPGGEYLDHLYPKSGTAADISDKIIDFLHESKSIHTLETIGADSTAVNTGEHNGVIRKIEKYIGRPLQRVICQLNLNELPTRRLYTKLLGNHTGPGTYAGEIGKAIKSDELRHMPVVEFNYSNQSMEAE